ncbi:MAG: hypothetical protein EOO03_12690, partial [Chitinophagaceae bacterium]
MTLLPTALVLLFMLKGFGQPTMTQLLEAPLHKTEKETTQFLQQAAGGKKAQMVWDGTYRSYSLEGPSFHIEYKVHQDTCVMAGIRFQQNGTLYSIFLRELMASTQAFGENRIKEASGRKIIYTLNTKERAVTVISYSFA